MHGPVTACVWWRRWRELEEERATIAAQIERHEPARAMVGRHPVTAATILQKSPPTGWERMDPAAMEARRRRIGRIHAELEDGQPGRTARRLEERARDLDIEAQRIAQRIHTAPVHGPADVLARLDAIAARWDAGGALADQGEALAELLALIDALTRCAPAGFTATWRRRRQRGRDTTPSGGMVEGRQGSP